MNFEEAINSVKELLKDLGTDINPADYDGLIVKKLEASNTLDANRTTNQTHNAITGDQMDIFPYFRSDGYFIHNLQNRKKYFIMQIPVMLTESNLKYINHDVLPEEMEFQSGKLKTYVSIVRSKREGQADQIQMSLPTYDDNNFIKFRKMLHVGAYLIILKKKELFEYEYYGILPDDVNDNLQELNNKFYEKPTNTLVHVDELFYEGIDQDYTEDELAEILKEFYNSPKYTNNAGIQLFGIIYGPFIKEKNYNIAAISKKAGIKESLTQELYKGIGLSNHIQVIEENAVSETRKQEENGIAPNYKTGYVSEFSRNRIVFGAPGTGKSYRLNEDRKILLKDGNEENYERVTFHPDYSYANFVGTYKPVPYKKGEEEGITYQYVPGPFMRIYVEAIKNSRTNHIKPYLLMIEEINRANVAAVFGDIFQLLDRDENHVSEYPIEASEDMKKYLAQELGGSPEDYKKIAIPDNMFIWATMNSADQGVFPMDTAFKRRWDFDYLGIDEKEEGIASKYVVLGKGEFKRNVEWNKLRKAINNKLSSLKINEDKLLGPYFIATKALESDELFIQVFKSKVLMYLFEDAAKQKRKALFATNDYNIRYSSLCKDFDEKGVYVFDIDISKEFDRDIA